MAPGFGMFMAAMAAIVCVVALLVAVLVIGLGSGWRRRGFSSDTTSLGRLGTLAGIPPLAAGGLYLALGGEVLGWVLLWLGGLVALAAGLLCSLVTLALWVFWARATRAGAPRQRGEWRVAVWSLAAALVGPVFIAVWMVAR